MKIKGIKKIVGIISGMSLLLFLTSCEFINQDNCLDKGGKWDGIQKTCVIEDVESSLKSSKQDVEALMNEWIVFAKRLLAEHGEFHPYGAAMKFDGEIVSIAGYTGEEIPPSQELIELLTSGFQQAAAKGKYKATALFYDVRIMLPNSTEKTDAIAVALDHSDAYSVIVFHPYKIVDEQFVFGDLTASKGANRIFR